MLFTNIQAFLSVATLGSLNKASEHQKVSTTAIMKRLNNLESDLNVKLLIRTKSGVKLTEAGYAFYNDAKLLTTYLEQCKQRVKKIGSHPYTIRIGASPLSPSNLFFEILTSLNKQNPNLNIEIISCQTVIESHLDTSLYQKLNLDAMLGVFDKDNLLKEGFNAIEISKLPFFISAPSCNHELALKSNLTYADFKNHTIYVPKRFLGKATTSLIQKFTQVGANIKIYKGFDVDLIHEIESTNSLLLGFSNVTVINPNFKILFINLNEFIDFGIIYKNDKDTDLKDFIKALKTIKTN